MRHPIGIILLLAGLALGYFDWREAGGELVFRDTATLWAAADPEGPETVLAWLSLHLPGWAVDPGATTLMALPLAPVLLVLAALLLWPRRRKRRGWYF